jgi:hypothetical protein
LTQPGFKPWLNQVKPPADVTDFEGSQLRIERRRVRFALISAFFAEIKAPVIRKRISKSGRNYAKV